ncbi:MAG: putative holin-like toxin [Lactobacillus sp.]|nr:putative holin-like toxin [Lactobacillus sp.]
MANPITWFGGGLWAINKLQVKGGALLIPVADAITLMLAFGSFIITLLEFVVVIVKAILDDEKNRR